MKHFSRAGVSLIELLIALAIFSILAMVVFSIFKTALSVWQTSADELRQRSKLVMSTPWLSSNLQSASKILYVTLADEPNGALQYTDSKARTVSVFMNSRVNQSRFGTNTLPSDNVVAMIKSDSVTSDPFPIFESVATFSVETFREDPAAFKISTPNNLLLPINYGAINSLRISVAVSVNNVIRSESQLIRLGTDALGDSETHFFGAQELPFSTDPNQFTLTGTQLKEGVPGQNPQDGPNALVLATANAVAKIRHSGEYFPTIQAAIDAASAGDIVMVAAGSYSEFITLKPGIIVIGGLDPVTWARNPSAHPSILKPGPGAISNAVVRMANSSQISGFKIDANNLLYGITASSVQNAAVEQVEIDRAENGIRFSSSGGRIENCSITGNTSALLTDTNCNGLSVVRNRLASRGLAKVPTVKIQSTTNFQFSNNLIIKGFTGFYAEATNGNIINNVFTGAANNAFTSQNRSGNSLRITNNIFIGNAFGIVGSSGDMTMSFNYFAQNGLGDGANSLFNGGGNIRDVTNTVPIGSINDPVFKSATTFELKSDSIVIDAGSPNNAFNDRYTNGPGLGTERSDMGAFGGPNAGRVGVGTTHTIAPSEASIQTRINDAWFGDYLFFKSGSYSVGALTLRDGVQCVGEDIETTILNISFNGSIQLANSSVMHDLTLKSNSGTALSAPGATSWFLDSLLIEGASVGLLAANSASGTIQNCTFFNNQIGISSNTSTVLANANIFSNCGIVAVKSVNATYSGKSNLFFNNTTDRSGPIGLSNDLGGDPLFWSSETQNFFLKPNSPAINAMAGRPLIDIGAFEFYKSVGTATSPLFSSTEARAYKSVSVKLWVDGNSALPNVDTRLTSVGLAYVLDGTTVTLSQSAVSTTNEVQTFTWNLAPRAIGNQFQAKLILTSYKRESTPYVSLMSLKW